MIAIFNIDTGSMLPVPTYMIHGSMLPRGSNATII